MLLTHFKSIKKLREAKEEEITAIVGVAKTKIVLAHLQQSEQ